MGSNKVEQARRQAASIVGWCYLVAMATAVFGFYVRGQLIVPGDAAATAANIVESEQFFRFRDCQRCTDICD